MSPYENPTIIVLLGILFLVVCIVLYLIDTKKGLIASIITLVVFAGWLFVERSVVTDTEQIHIVLEKMLEDVKNQRDTAVLEAFEKGSNARKAVESRIRSYIINSGNLSDIKIDLKSKSADGPRKAEVIFAATGRVSSKGGSLQKQVVRAYFKLYMRRTADGPWRTYEVEIQRIGANQPWISL